MSKTTSNKNAGKTAKELKDDFSKIHLIYEAREAGMSFSQIEAKFGLRDANGMTAYRLVQRAKKLKRSK